VWAHHVVDNADFVESDDGLHFDEGFLVSQVKSIVWAYLVHLCDCMHRDASDNGGCIISRGALLATGVEFAGDRTGRVAVASLQQTAGAVEVG
jgi:hypothetical protein